MLIVLQVTMCYIEKVHYCGSVTCVSYGNFNDRSLLLWSNGGVLTWFDQLHGQEDSIRVFEYNYIHGIKVYPQFNLLLVYGNKSLAILRFHDHADVMCAVTLVMVNDQLDDMVLDAVILNESLTTTTILGLDEEEATVVSNHCISLYVGFAHNFYDKVTVTVSAPKAQSNSNCTSSSSYSCYSWKRENRCQSPDICVLFALTLSVNPMDHEDVIVASGNVFGKLSLWKKSNRDSDANSVGVIGFSSMGMILGSIHLHEGVIFRVIWKTKANGQRDGQILTVSDDRTVRLWAVDVMDSTNWTLSQVFVGWGHISRVWDAIFLESLDSDSEIATCSEDGTIKLWNRSGQCTATFEGHSGSVWRITAVPYYTRSDELGQHGLIVSGGNDGSVKFWDIDYHRHNSPKDELSTMTNMLIPDWPLSSADDKSESKPVEAEDMTKVTMPAEEADVAVPQEDVADHTDSHENETDQLQKDKKKKKSQGKQNNQHNANRRKNGVNMLRISPCGQYLLLVMIDGKLWYVPIQSTSTSTSAGTASTATTISGSFKFGEWKPIVDLQKVIVEADIAFHPIVDNDHESQGSGPREADCQIFVAASSIDGTALCFSFLLQDVFSGKTMLPAEISPYVWKPHPMKTVNIWFPKHFSSSSSRTNKLKNANKSDELKTCLTMVTATLQGLGTVWTWETEHRIDRDTPEKTDPIVRKTMSFVTGRKEIASSCLLYTYQDIHSSHSQSFLLVGDSRGGVNIYSIFQDSATLSDVQDNVLQPIQFFPFIHKSDPVSALTGCHLPGGRAGEACGFYSAGHDNFLAFFRLHLERETREGSKGEGEEEQLMMRCRWSFENIVTTTPVQTPDQIIVTTNPQAEGAGNEEDESNRSIFLTGYYGSSFIVYDIRRGMQILKIEGGGWKRPHHSQLVFSSFENNQEQQPLAISDDLPTILFACPAPVGKKETELQLFGYQAAQTQRQRQSVAIDPTRIRRSNRWPLQLGTPSFSNVSNCSVIVKIPSVTSFTVVGGEDCMMRVFSHYQYDQQEDSSHSNTTTPSQAKLLMETTLSKNSSLKSLSTVPCHHDLRKGIVVGAGGKLLFYVWTYDYSNRVVPSSSACQRRKHLMDLSPLRKVYAGTILQNASQDHRILSVKTVFIGQEEHQVPRRQRQATTQVAAAGIESEEVEESQIILFDHFVIVLADSRGFITVVDFLYHFSNNNENQLDHTMQSYQYQVRILYQAEVSTCPLLGCDMHFLDQRENENVRTTDDRFILIATGDTKGSLIYTIMPVIFKQQK